MCHYVRFCGHGHAEKRLKSCRPSVGTRGCKRGGPAQSAPRWPGRNRRPHGARPCTRARAHARGHAPVAMASNKRLRPQALNSNSGPTAPPPVRWRAFPRALRACEPRRMHVRVRPAEGLRISCTWYCSFRVDSRPFVLSRRTRAQGATAVRSMPVGLRACGQPPCCPPQARALSPPPPP